MDRLQQPAVTGGLDAEHGNHQAEHDKFRHRIEPRDRIGIKDNDGAVDIQRAATATPACRSRG